MAVVTAWVNDVDTSTLLIFLVVFLCSVWLRGTPIKWPPGPKSWPIIGNADVFWNNEHLYLTLTDLAKTYGEIVHLRVGPQNHVVVLTGNDVIREAFVDNGEYFSNRPTFIPLVKYTSGGKGVVMQDGAHWKSLRRFTLKALRDFGVGKSTLEEKIKYEVDFVLAEFDNKKGMPFDPKEIFDKAVSNIICSIIFGQRYNYDNEEFQHLLNSLSYIFENSGAKNAGASFLPGPVALVVIPKFRKFVKVNHQIKEFIRKIIAEHRETFDEDNVRDFIDLYLKAERCGDEDGAFTDENMFQVIVDLFMAGSETTTTTLRWMLLYMILNPQMQAKCRQEMAQVVDQGIRPGMRDRGQLPFTEATILETHRLGSIAPTGVVHVVSESITFRGYDLPKGTLIIPNLYQSHVDPMIWEEPFSFNPDRWLDENNKIKNNPAFIPFSVGSRMCIGDSLAKMEMFLLTTALLQTFVFRMVDDNHPPGSEGKQGLTRSPSKYELIAVRV